MVDDPNPADIHRETRSRRGRRTAAPRETHARPRSGRSRGRRASRATAATAAADARIPNKSGSELDQQSPQDEAGHITDHFSAAHRRGQGDQSGHHPGQSAGPSSCSVDQRAGGVRVPTKPPASAEAILASPCILSSRSIWRQLGGQLDDRRIEQYARIAITATAHRSPATGHKARQSARKYSPVISGITR